METTKRTLWGPGLVGVMLITSLAGWCVGASGAVLGIDSTVTNPALTTTNTPEAEIVSFAAGAQAYGALEFLTATTINNTVQTFAAASSPDPADDLPTALSVISNGYITQGKANATGVNYQIGEAVDAVDGDLFFMYELVLNGEAGDDVVVLPLSGETPIAGWSLTINAADYGPQTDTYRMTLLPSADVGARGVTFTLADFTGGAGELTGVTGLRFNDANTTWDPLAVGRVVAVIPEPGAAMALAVIAMYARRRPRTGSPAGLAHRRNTRADDRPCSTSTDG